MMINKKSAITMRKSMLTTVIVFLSVTMSMAQGVKADIYEGMMNDTIDITLFLITQEHPCEIKQYYTGMYKYDNQSEWIQMHIEANDKMQFSLVEYGFTGTMILQKTGETLTGIWIRPDTKKQYKVELKRMIISDNKKESYHELFEEVNYQNNDC